MKPCDILLRRCSPPFRTAPVGGHRAEPCTAGCCWDPPQRSGAAQARWGRGDAGLPDSLHVMPVPSPLSVPTSPASLPWGCRARKPSFPLLTMHIFIFGLSFSRPLPAASPGM
eukprot:TRINITY_DN66412_c0_g1_i1.p1 TRINITY_DN66412_c0_g1~~TRINITY_DN66412_c0_g1_i1.p1  ORF type:complete len:113 (-),score=10.24 TRINITY_DN66412_c0_g1_i1:47-385(-)